MGPGTRTMTWTPEPGWTLVVMNADGTAPVKVSVSAGVQAPALRPAAGTALAVGGVLLLLGVGGIALGGRPRRDEKPLAVG